MHPQITPLQMTAWTVANMSYWVPDGAPYRAHAADLYREDVRRRIVDLFAALDRQNVQIDAALAARSYRPADEASPPQAARDWLGSPQYLLPCLCSGHAERLLPSHRS
jgi:hypothetical protein